MRAVDGPAYRPEHFVRGFSRELVTEHVAECLAIYHELDEELGIPEPIAGAVFATVQTMVASIEPREGSPAAAAAAARAKLALPGNGLVGV